MQESTAQPRLDEALLKRFRSEIKSKVPSVFEKDGKKTIVNPTPLEDLTAPLVECARVEYGLEIAPQSIKVFGKFDSRIAGGSVKVRPAVEIIEDAIVSGKLRTGQTVFEATSGNFGIALEMLEKIGINVIFLVSRKLQSGVLDELNKNSAKTVNLDIDICPAPGLAMDQNLVIAKATASNVRGQLLDLGLDGARFDKARAEIEGRLARQDVINLAKLLAKVYGGFCPEQYDNELNVKSHETVTAPEIDQQLKEYGLSLAEFKIISAFGTGGTSAGLSKYIQTKYGKKSVHLVFPLNNQDVAGVLEVTLPQASTSVADYGEVLWTHGMFVPKEDGIKLLSSSLGCDESKIKVARASDVQTLISTEKIPDNITSVLPKDNRKVLLVCMAGATSLRVAQILAANGIQGQSLTGGIMSLSENSKKQPSDLVQMARE